MKGAGTSVGRLGRGTAICSNDLLTVVSNTKTAATIIPLHKTILCTIQSLS